MKVVHRWGAGQPHSYLSDSTGFENADLMD